MNTSTGARTASGRGGEGGRIDIGGVAPDNEDAAAVGAAIIGLEAIAAAVRAVETRGYMDGSVRPAYPLVRTLVVSL